MLGEDPYLSSVLVGYYVLGAQSEGVIATAKHFIDNDQEYSIFLILLLSLSNSIRYDRFGISVIVDERTQWEVYCMWLRISSD